MNTKHTPGPWVIDHVDNSEAVISREDITWSIATCFCEPMDDEVRANAKLIAAAPDLLEALSTILITPCDLVPSHRQKALEAIKKAAE